MKFTRVFYGFLFFAIFSCGALPSSQVEETTAEGGHIQSGAYPSTTSSKKDSSEDPAPDVDGWMCGFEQIVIEDPDGKLVVTEIPLTCDPIADVYMGCEHTK